VSGSTSEWRGVFEHWPADWERRGILVSKFQETIEFADFRIAGELLLVERERPDSLGGRKVIMSFDAVAALKTKDTDALSKYRALGFVDPTP